MNWLKKIFAKPSNGPMKEPVRGGLEATHGQELPFPQAAEIQTQTVEEWAKRLEAEGLRTGNQRLITKAETIRARWGIPRHA